MKREEATCKSGNGELGNGIRGMMGMRGIGAEITFQINL